MIDSDTYCENNCDHDRDTIECKIDGESFSAARPLTRYLRICMMCVVLTSIAVPPSGDMCVRPRRRRTAPQLGIAGQQWRAWFPILNCARLRFEVSIVRWGGHRAYVHQARLVHIMPDVPLVMQKVAKYRTWLLNGTTRSRLECGQSSQTHDYRI